MAEVYIPNRDLIKNLKWNTGTTASPTYTNVCTTSEVGIDIDLETKDWYVYCDALQRRLVTGGSVTLSGTIKLDVNNAAEMDMLGTIHTMIASGTIAQFNNLMIQFELLSGYSSSTLTYTTYSALANLTIESIGGAAEDVTEVSATFTLNGTATAEVDIEGTGGTQGAVTYTSSNTNVIIVNGTTLNNWKVFLNDSNNIY